MHINSSVKKFYFRYCSFVIIPTLLDPRYKNNFNVFPSIADRTYNKKLLLSEMKQSLNPERGSLELHPPPAPMKNSNCDPMSEFLSAAH